MSLQELQVSALFAGRQTAKGTPNAAPGHRFKAPGGGGFNVARDDGSEQYSDATAQPGTEDWVNSLMGNAAPPILGTPEEVAFLAWAFAGGETATAVSGPPAKTKHLVVPLPGLGHWTTWVTRLGSSVVDRLQHNDCQISQLVIAASSADKILRVTPTIMSLDPGEQRAADPTQVMPSKASMLYTDGTGRFAIDGTVFRGASAFTTTISKDLQPVYSDDTVVYDFGFGVQTSTLVVTLHFDPDARAQFNKIVYGSTAPAAGTKPRKTIGALGSYQFDLRARDSAGAVNGDKFVFTMPAVKWAVPDAPDPAAAGGSPTIELAGAMRKVAGQPDWSIDIDCDAAAFVA